MSKDISTQITLCYRSPQLTAVALCLGESQSRLMCDRVLSTVLGEKENPFRSFSLHALSIED